MSQNPSFSFSFAARPTDDLPCRNRKSTAPGLDLIAQDEGMVRVLDMVRQVAPTTMPVLICGESGTGKELIAQALHAHSRNPALPFLALNAAALPDTLLEAELFGHVKGAFTGADRCREGLFAQAKGGTVFLDEIALMSWSFQSKLLRVLQEHSIVPLGSSTPRPVDFRLVVATNRSLRELIDAGEFREDLYYRLRVVSLKVPPLRDRPADILPLATHFLTRHLDAADLGTQGPPALSSEAVEALRRHPWPGNVRELENCIQRALILSRGREIRCHHLGIDEESFPWLPAESEELSYEEGKQQVITNYQRRCLRRALRKTSGNISRAAILCGLTRAAFQRIMRSLELNRGQFSDPS